MKFITMWNEWQKYVANIVAFTLRFVAKNEICSKDSHIYLLANDDCVVEFRVFSLNFFVAQSCSFSLLPTSLLSHSWYFFHSHARSFWPYYEKENRPLLYLNRCSQTIPRSSHILEPKTITIEYKNRFAIYFYARSSFRYLCVYFVIIKNETIV